MKRPFALISLMSASACAFAALFSVIQTPAGEIRLNNNRIIYKGERLYVTRDVDGKREMLESEHLFESSGKNPGMFLSRYWDAKAGSHLLTQHMIVTDATGKEVRLSNALDTGLDFQWGDNNYVIFESNTIYFGIYSPKRMQFVYKDGALEENKSPWRGPSKPLIYIAPTGDDPCGNVNGVEACREEVAREQERKAQQRRKKIKSTIADK
jgi:hypothetical protein